MDAAVEAVEAVRLRGQAHGDAAKLTAKLMMTAMIEIQNDFLFIIEKSLTN